MLMNFGEVLNIEDLGNHSAATVISLGILLAGTVNVRPDPKRKRLYEIDGDRTVYYVYVSPVTGTIFFLASWENCAASRSQVGIADSVSSAYSSASLPRGSETVGG